MCVYVFEYILYTILYIYIYMLYLNNIHIYINI